MKSLALLLASLFTLGDLSLHAQEGNSILVISPGNGQLPGLSSFMSGFRRGLTTNLTQRVVTYSEYLNSELLDDSDYQQEMVRWMRLKYRGNVPLVLVSADEESAPIVFKIRNELWPKTPVVFIDRGDAKEFGTTATNATSISVFTDVKQTLQAALELCPQMKRIALVSGGKKVSAEFFRYNLGELQSFAGNRFELIDLSGLAMLDLRERIAKLPPQTIVFFDGTWSDSTGQFLTPRDAVERFSEKCNAPIFSCGETFIGAGVVGGSCTIYNSLGMEASKQVAAVIRAGSADAVPPVQSTAKHYVFDSQLLQRFGLSKNSLPPNSNLRFQPVTVWSSHRNAIILIGTIVLAQSISIALLLAQRRRMKRSEEELFNSRHMLQTILDTVPQRIFWKDRNCVFLGCNKPMSEDCGYSSAAELVGKMDQQTIAAKYADRYQEDDRRVMETGESKLNFEEPQTRKDGKVGWLRTNKVPLRDKNNKIIGVLGTYEDITERKRMEDQIRQMQKMEAFGQLAAGVAHDFNNILTVIQGNLMLLQGGQLSQEEQSSAYQQSIAAAQRAANLTRQLLTFGRRQIMQPVDLDLNAVVSNVTKMLQRLIGENITLETRYTPGGAYIHADMSMMEQILMNLAINSRDAMPKGGNLLIQTAAVTLNDEQAIAKSKGRAGKFIRLTVTDNGCGISPKDLPHIFEPFFTTKEIGKGTGLGLATVFGIVEQHHGWIDVESEVGKGTTMSIFFSQIGNSSKSAT